MATAAPILFRLLCIGVVFLVVAGGVVLLIVNQTRSRKIHAIPTNWVAVTAQIIAVVEEAAPTDDDHFYFPSIEFTYTVEGHAYQGKHAVGKPYNFTRKAEQTLKNYPVGSDVVVHYNSENPSETRISPS